VSCHTQFVSVVSHLTQFVGRTWRTLPISNRLGSKPLQTMGQLHRMSAHDSFGSFRLNCFWKDLGAGNMPFRPVFETNHSFEWSFGGRRVTGFYPRLILNRSRGVFFVNRELCRCVRIILIVAVSSLD